MATIDDAIKFTGQQVENAVQDSRQFINELSEAIGWQSTLYKGGIDLTKIASNDNISVSTLGIPQRPSTTQFVWNEQMYDAPLLKKARDIILFDLTNGGYGLDPRDEQALWERAKDREAQNANNAIQDFQRSISARGFSIPSGAMLAGLQKVQQQSRGAISTHNRDISIKRADMYVQARQFALTTGINAEQYLINYHSNYADRTLNSLRLMLEKAGVDVKIWEASKADAIRDAEFYLNKWAKQTEAFLQIAKIQLAESEAVSANEHNITVEGISASAQALDTYKAIITAANNATSAIQTLAN
jgi:hypothetical protein